MSLRIIWTSDEHLIAAPVASALRRALARRGRALLLVPDHARQIEASKVLANAGMSLGVSVATPLSYARERWDVWGDGMQLVNPTLRLALMEQVLASADASQDQLKVPHPYPGTVRLLCDLARVALPWMPLTSEGKPDKEACLKASCTAAERGAVSALGQYRHVLHSLGYIEQSELLSQACASAADGGAAPVPTVLCGFLTLDRATRELAKELARLSELYLISRDDASPATMATRNSVQDLARLCRNVGVTVEEERDDRSSLPERAPELASLRQTLFSGSVGSLEATGAFDLLEPAGPTAEAEAICRRIEDLAADGSKRIAVAAPDAGRLWRELAPKLHVRGFAVRACLSERVGDLACGQALLSYLDAVAGLAKLARTWPSDEHGPEGDMVRLGDMSWWPPSNLTDFLLSEISGVSEQQAWRLDRTWRQDRLLTPQDVIDCLLSPSQTSTCVAAATRELLRGRAGAAARRLMEGLVSDKGCDGDDSVEEEGLDAPVRGDKLSRARAAGVLAAMMEAASTLGELSQGGLIPQDGDPLDVLPRVGRLMRHMQVITRPFDPGTRQGFEVELLDVASASRLAPASFDALVLAGQTSAESPVPRGDDECSSLLAHLDIERDPDPLSVTRASFATLISVPSRVLVVERTSRDASSTQCHPSPMLTELLACYGVSADDDDDEMPIELGVLTETDAQANLALAGHAPAASGTDRVSAAGLISPARRELVVVPPEGKANLVDGKPLLSASQIESYLECPYKWFSLRRLRLRDSDARFSSTEMGTFAHRVLELTHERLLKEAAEEQGISMDDLCDDPRIRVLGSRVTTEDEASFDYACQIMNAAFDEHERNQLLRQGKRRRYQPFVAHTDEERGMLARLRRDLLSVLDFERGILLGYEPRFFEWSFGCNDSPVEYAGAYVTGTVDRIDVDAHGNACVIDYKHKGPSGFLREYAVFGEGTSDAAFELPRRVQTLIYAQVVRHAFSELSVQGAVYLSTRTDASHVLSGAVASNAVENVFGDHALQSHSLPCVEVPGDFGTSNAEEARGMTALLDATEKAIAERIAELLEGNVEARPRDRLACAYCPVMNCERRLS